VHGGDWKIDEDPLPIGAKRLGASYAPTGFFLVSTLTDFESTPSLVSIAPSGMIADLVEFEEMRVFDIGPGACALSNSVSHCTIPYSTNEFGGPHLGWLDVRINIAGAITIVGAGAVAVAARGKLGLSSRMDLSIHRGAAGEQRYEIAQLLVEPWAPMPSPFPVVDGEGWPMSLGSIVPNGETAHWRGFVRRGVECGNGILQGAEECDDGNLVGGDGCNEQCLIEAATSEGGGDGTGGDGADGVGKRNDDGCTCTADTRRSRSFGLIAFAGLWLMLRRRSPSRRPRSRAPTCGSAH
jgi:cysteine-rich repeat protein